MPRLPIKTAKWFAATVSVSVMLSASSAFAQSSPQPSRSVETFSNWDVECTTVKVRPKKKAEKKDKKKTKKKEAKAEEAKVETRSVCEAVQPYRNRKTSNEVARMAIAIDPDSKDGLVAVLRTLTNMSFSKTPSIVNDGKELLKGKFRSCFNQYCYIRFSIGKKSLANVLKAKKLAVQYPVASGETIRINMSTNGMKDAIASLRSK